jgi:hypothetical protein
MIKHVGLHNAKKIVIIRHTVPDEDHMCLVVYTEKLPPMYHDEVIKVLESAPGQQAKDLDSVLHRNSFPDGRNILETLHKEGHLKKVQNNQVFITVNPQSKIYLSELNDLMAKLAQGGEAANKLQRLEEEKGMRSAQRRAGKNPIKSTQQNILEAQQTLLTAPINGVLSDTDIAMNLLDQASKMQASAQNMLAESGRLAAQAADLVRPLVQNQVAQTTQIKTRKKSGPKPKIKVDSVG